MAKFYPIFIGFFILVSAWPSGSTADDSLSLAQLQEQFQQLKTNYVRQLFFTEFALNRIECSSRNSIQVSFHYEFQSVSFCQ
jgi:hypothetical protein